MPMILDFIINFILNTIFTTTKTIQNKQEMIRLPQHSQLMGMNLSVSDFIISNETIPS